MLFIFHGGSSLRPLKTAEKQNQRVCFLLGLHVLHSLYSYSSFFFNTFIIFVHSNDSVRGHWLRSFSNVFPQNDCQARRKLVFWSPAVWGMEATDIDN